MKTTRWLVGAALVGSVFSLGGCGGGGTYQIPNVAPVVMQKPDNDLLEDIEGTDKTASDATPSTASSAKAADANEPLPDADAEGKTESKSKSKSKK